MYYFYKHIYCKYVNKAINIPIMLHPISQRMIKIENGMLKSLTPDKNSFKRYQIKPLECTQMLPLISHIWKLFFLKYYQTFDRNVTNFHLTNLNSALDGNLT